MKLTVEHAIATIKAIQEVSAEADTVRKRDKSEQIVKKITQMLLEKEGSITMLISSIRSQQSSHSTTTITGLHCIYSTSTVTI
ncbi:MAG: hypothetical protein KGH61_03795 [Candidatus Micrarchaeota archaeon]|nr:hypothetical protein [Candidatus Micrarchaeota archaeon]MDE1848044.1 hypothetical protein [Candidatus Micrarchaeota archaeon]MDE1864725.1 hypothetical protein [Candidatus Micrarchaeota archaeon]